MRVSKCGARTSRCTRATLTRAKHVPVCATAETAGALLHNSRYGMWTDDVVRIVSALLRE